MLSTLALATMVQLSAQPQELVPGTRYDPAIPTLEEVAGHGFGEAVTPPDDVIRYMEALSGAAPASGVNPGETQRLRLLLRYPSCREAGQALDADTFEDGAHRRLFEAWRASDDLDERVAELDEDLRELHASLLATAVPEAYERMTAAQLGEVVESTAWQLRARRRQARVRAEAGAVAQQVAEARREGAGVLEFARTAAERGALPADAASEEAELAASFVDLSNQQRELARAFASASEGPGVPADRDGGAEQIEHTELHTGVNAPDGAQDGGTR